MSLPIKHCSNCDCEIDDSQTYCSDSCEETAELRSQLSECQREMDEARKREQLGCAHPWKCSRETLLMQERYEQQLAEQSKIADDFQEMASQYQTDNDALQQQLQQMKEANEGLSGHLLELAARFARKEFVLNIEGCRTIDDARKRVETQSDQHGQFALVIRALLKGKGE